MLASADGAALASVGGGDAFAGSGAVFATAGMAFFTTGLAALRGAAGFASSPPQKLNRDDPRLRERRPRRDDDTHDQRRKQCDGSYHIHDSRPEL